jgi:nucleoside-diphosphate-sugar epimerase
MKICISGANGFIGSHLVSALKYAGADVISLCRTPKKESDGAFDLTRPESFQSIPMDTDLIIHGAYVTQGKDLKDSYRINVDGSRALFSFAKERGIKILFISSCSAHAEALSFYGRSKYLLEQLLDAQTDIIVRPGFVIGDGGIYKRLQMSIRKLKFVPLFWGGRQHIQTIHIHDLCQAIVSLIQNNKTGIYNLVNEKTYSIQKFYGSIFAQLNIKPRFIKCPSRTTLLFLKTMEALGVPLPITSENLLGLKALNLFKSDLAGLVAHAQKDSPNP